MVDPLVCRASPPFAAFHAQFAPDHPVRFVVIAPFVITVVPIGAIVVNLVGVETPAISVPDTVRLPVPERS